MAIATPAVPRRVVVMIDSLLTGGAERVAVDAACSLDRARYAPHVLVTRGSGPLEARLRAAGVPFTVLGRRRRLSLRAYSTAVAVVGDSHLIHAHKFGSAVWGALLSRRTGTPLIVHEHNWSGTPSRTRALLNRRWLASTAAVIACPSASVAESLARDGVPRQRIAIVPNGVDTGGHPSKAQARAALGLPDDAFVIGMSAAFRPEKAHEVLLEATAGLLAAGRDVLVCLIGGGPQEAYLRRCAQRLGISGHIRWAGWRDEAPALVTAFDVAVICSDWEGMPLAALEAAAAQVPLVATAVGGLPELVCTPQHLVPPRDPHRLSEALAAVIDDRDAAQVAAAAMHRRVVSRHGIDRMAVELQALYDLALQPCA